MKRILVITYYWPPTGGSGVQRWVKFSRYLPAEGWEPVIYTPENPEMITVDESLLKDVPQNIEVLKTRISEPYDIYRKFLGRKQSSKQDVNPINGSKKSFKQKLSLFIRANCFIPDPRVSWVKPSVRYLEKYIQEHPVDLIVTTAPPQSIHLIGKNLSARTGIPWIADFRDPWTKMFYFKYLPFLPFARRKQFRLEKEVLDNASAIVAVTPLVREDFQQMTKTPVALVTNGYDEEDFDVEVPRTDGFFNITHTGLFSLEGIPDVLWKVLSSKCAEDSEFDSKLKIRLVGKVDAEVLESIEEAGLSDKLIRLGYLDHKEAVKEQMGASVLLLPLRKDPEYRKTLPGKVFEYLGARRPILGIGQNDGAMSRILEETGAGAVFDWDDEKGMAEFIDHSWESFRKGELVVDSDGIERYSRRALTKKMVELFNKVTK